MLGSVFSISLRSSSPELSRHFFWWGSKMLPPISLPPLPRGKSEHAIRYFFCSSSFFISFIFLLLWLIGVSQILFIILWIYIFIQTSKEISALCLTDSEFLKKGVSQHLSSSPCPVEDSQKLLLHFSSTFLDVTQSRVIIISSLTWLSDPTHFPQLPLCFGQLFYEVLNYLPIISYPNFVFLPYENTHIFSI